MQQTYTSGNGSVTGRHCTQTHNLYCNVGRSEKFCCVVCLCVFLFVCEEVSYKELIDLGNYEDWEIIVSWSPRKAYGMNFHWKL